MYMSEFRFQVLTAITSATYPEFTHATRNNSEGVIDKLKLQPSFIMSYSTKVINKV